MRRRYCAAPLLLPPPLPESFQIPSGLSRTWAAEGAEGRRRKGAFSPYNNNNNNHQNSNTNNDNNANNENDAKKAQNHDVDHK